LWLFLNKNEVAEFYPVPVYAFIGYDFNTCWTASLVADLFLKVD